jgi:hypothetical protein
VGREVSFSWNPYEHVEVVHDPRLAGDLAPLVIHCNSCGGNAGRVSFSAPLEMVFNLMATHVRCSHKRTPDDFKTWSRY